MKMDYEEALQWIRQEAEILGVSEEEHKRTILTDYANRQKLTAKVVHIKPRIPHETV